MIDDNVKNILERIEKAKDKIGQKNNIKLVAVTKTVAVDKITEAISFGVTDIGENRVQEAIEKFSDKNFNSNNIKKHLIGHLQTNKVKKAIELFDIIQSVDSIYLLEEINKQSEKIKKVQDCMVEIKISEEETKYGLMPDKLGEFLVKAKELKNIRIVGLMSIAPFFDNPELVRLYFRKAKELFDKFHSEFSVINNQTYLSMGMTNDFEVAIEEGATIIRVGTALFGKRKPKN
jgi:PLP dependent protein